MSSLKERRNPSETEYRLPTDGRPITVVLPGEATARTLDDPAVPAGVRATARREHRRTLRDNRRKPATA